MVNSDTYSHVIRIHIRVVRLVLFQYEVDKEIADFTAKDRCAGEQNMPVHLNN